MKLLICGEGRHGKSFAGEILQEEFGAKAISSSEFTCEKVVFPLLKDKYGYKTPEEAYNDRGAHRKEWYDIIRDYTSNDPARLAKEILAEHDVYIGMRSAEEFRASWHLFHARIWIDATHRLGNTESKSSITIDPDDLDATIYNNGTKEEFKSKIVSLYYNLFL